MAQSRLERIGTIYTRTKSLLHAGAMKNEDKPLWYVIYEAFPPKVEPRYDREVPKIPIRELFYKEDIIRAKFHRDHKNFLSLNLYNTKYKSNTQRFLEIYNDMEKSGIPEEELYSKALEAYRIQVQSVRPSIGETAESGDHVKNEAKQQQTNVDLKKVFDA